MGYERFLSIHSLHLCFFVYFLNLFTLIKNLNYISCYTSFCGTRLCLCYLQYHIVWNTSFPFHFFKSVSCADKFDYHAISHRFLCCVIHFSGFCLTTTQYHVINLILNNSVCIFLLSTVYQQKVIYRREN